MPHLSRSKKGRVKSADEPQRQVIARILGVLEETEFPPERLQIEITENVLIEDHQTAGEGRHQLGDHLDR